MPSASYETVNKAWKSTCKVLLREEVGELSDFYEWLEEYSGVPRFEKSFISGKEVELASKDYLPGQKFASFDEIAFGKKFQPLSINQVKDIDSIIEAMHERIFYTGNIILGNSSGVEKSSSVVDSHFVHRSNYISDSKYVACSPQGRLIEYCFGFMFGGESSHAIRSGGGNLVRCMETIHCQSVSDCYYVTNSQSVREAMFCFGIKSNNYVIGNLSLPKEKYLAIKSKLLPEMASTLRKEKKLFTLYKLVEQAAKHEPSKINLPSNFSDGKPFKKDSIENSFSSTSQLLLGRKLSEVDAYSAFLNQHVPTNAFVKSPLSQRKITLGGFRTWLLSRYKLEGRLVDQDELFEVGKTSITGETVKSISFSLDELSTLLSPIAYAALDNQFGYVQNTKYAATTINCIDCYQGSAFVKCKKCAYSYWPRESEHIFGSSMMWASSFCMKCFNSKKLTRAFYSDNCDSCADIYYSHNCENVQDSMFCFNVKNLSHAIGNAPMPLEQYKGIKAAIVGQIADELEKKKDLKWDIFSLGAKQR